MRFSKLIGIKRSPCYLSFLGSLQPRQISGLLAEIMVYIDKWISFVFAMELPIEFLDTQKDFSGMKDAREFLQSRHT